MIKHTSLAVILLATLTACSSGSSDSKVAGHTGGKASSANQPTN